MGGNPGSKCYEECLQPFADLLRTKKLAWAKEGTETLETHAWAVVSPTFSGKVGKALAAGEPQQSRDFRRELFKIGICRPASCLSLIHHVSFEPSVTYPPHPWIPMMPCFLPVLHRLPRGIVQPSSLSSPPLPVFPPSPAPQRCPSSIMVMARRVLTPQMLRSSNGAPSSMEECPSALDD